MQIDRQSSMSIYIQGIQWSRTKTPEYPAKQKETVCVGRSTDEIIEGSRDEGGVVNASIKER